MEEKIITGKKNGMIVLVLALAAMLAGILLVVLVGIRGKGVLAPILGVIGLILVVAGVLSLCGLRVLKPQEALVVTLFGKYVGTLKGEGFYAIHPFSTSVNPAAKTRLGQSGDVEDNGNSLKSLLASSSNSAAHMEETGKKISLKAMTLSNSKQKVNDVLGNPVDIGIAVMWRVVDTAKAVFTVDNFKEYLSLQCDSAVRNIVKLYPYDVAPNIDTTGDGLADDGSLRGSSDLVVRRIRD